MPGRPVLAGAGGGAALFAGSGVSFSNAGVITGGSGGAGATAAFITTQFIHNGVPDDPVVGTQSGGIGGAGGTGVLFSGAGSTFNNSGSVAGGAGGAAGSVVTPGGNSGAGGVGGNGVVFAGSGSTLINSGHITGGNGGNADPAGSGSGGEAGSAVVMLGGGTITNTASGTITGGNNGQHGSTFCCDTNVTGMGIVGAGLTINNSGTITGGTDSITRALAIQLTGGANFVSTGGTIIGGLELQQGSLMPALPGSTVGPTLNVNGFLSIEGVKSTYQIRVNGAANDSITATGSASLFHANVSATVTGNALGQHTIITASQLFGTFDSVSLSTNSAFELGSLAYDPTHVFLDIIGNGANGKVDFTAVTQTTNQFNVASALNTAGAANGFSGPLFNLILGLSASQARAAFTALDGEVATGAQRASFRLMDEFLNLMLDPFVEGHFGNPSGGATGFAPEQQAELPPEIATAYASVFKTPPPANFEQRWSIWNAAFGGSGRTNGDPLVGSSDTRLSTYGFAGGIDYRFSPYTVVGLAAAGGGTRWDLSTGLGTGRSDSAQIGAYARTRIGAAYIAESIAFASHWFSTDRTALGDNLHATFTGESFGGRIEGGYRFAATPNFGITPYAAAQAQAFHSGGYSETDLNNLGFGLSYAAKEATDVRTEIGARFDSPTLLNGTPLVIRARLAWAHDIVDTPALGASFQTLPLSNFTVFGAAIPHNSGLASIGADWYLNRDWKLLAKFDGEFARGSDIYAGTVALRYSW